MPCPEKFNLCNSNAKPIQNMLPKHINLTQKPQEIIMIIKLKKKTIIENERKNKKTCGVVQ